jgi:hypothetical protein
MSTLEATRSGVEDKALMEEMVAWIKGLREAGVSADKAAEVSKDIMIALLNSYAEDEDEEEYEDDEEE